MKIKVLRALQYVAVLALTIAAYGIAFWHLKWVWAILGIVAWMYLRWSDQQPGFFLRDDYYII